MNQLCLAPRPGPAPSTPGRSASRPADQATGATPTFQEVLGQHTGDGAATVVPLPVGDAAVSPVDESAVTAPAPPLLPPVDPPVKPASTPAPAALPTVPTADGATSTDTGAAVRRDPMTPTDAGPTNPASPGQVTASPAAAAPAGAPGWAAVTGASDSAMRVAATPVAPPASTTGSTPVPATEPVAFPAGPVPAAPASSAAVPAPEQPSAPAPATPSLPAQVVPRLMSVRSLGDGVHRLTLRVEPESIGSVRVVAEVRGEVVRLELVGGTEAAREALRAVLPELKRDLAATGMQAQLELGDPGDRHTGDRPERAARQQEEGRPAPDHPETAAAPTPDRADAVPATGRVDVLA